MILKRPTIFNGNTINKVYNMDIFDLLNEIEIDLAYFDPPYGSNNDKMPSSRIRYASYYHIWETIIKNDKPLLTGKSKRRKDKSDKLSYSLFEDFKKHNDKYIAEKAIENLIDKVNSKYVMLSYNSNGRASIQNLYNHFNDKYNIVNVIEMDYKKNVMANMKWCLIISLDLYPYIDK